MLNFATVWKSFPLLEFVTVKETFTLSANPFTLTFVGHCPGNHKDKYGNVLFHDVKLIYRLILGRNFTFELLTVNVDSSNV
jgi:hypothetical protein